MHDHIKRSITSVTAVALAAVLANRLEGRPTDPYDSYRQRTSVALPVTSRDFGTAHPDFAGNPATAGEGRYARIPADTLPADGAPVFNSTGYQVVTDWRDSAGRPVIATRPYLTAMPGDAPGSMSGSAGGAISSSASFAQWFRPVSGVNTEYHNSMVLNRTGGTYVFDGSLDAFAGHPDFDYTAAIDTTFIHDTQANYYLQFATGAEVFVYIDGKLVIDGGGGLGSGASDPGLPGGHFDVDVYNAPSTHQRYHKHEYDDTYDVTWVDIVNDQRLLFASIAGSSYPNPLRLHLFNRDNAGAGNFSFAAGSVTAAGPVRFETADRVFTAASLTQLRIDFRTLALMAHTNPGASHNDVPNRAGAFGIRLYDTVTGAMKYELTVYHHGDPPPDYDEMRRNYENNGIVPGVGMPAMTQRIDLSRLPWLQNGETHDLKVFFANRTGTPSQVRFETNIDTLNLVALPPTLIQKD